MKIFAISGSPTPKGQSITELILSQFLKGCISQGATTDVVYLSEKKILPCDCGHIFACWVKTPGICIYHDKDDVSEILTKMIKADTIIFATPIYLESMTGQLKTFLDRTFPLVYPYIESFKGESRHPLRKLRENIRFVIVSVCGHYEITNFSALVHTFERIARNLHGKLAGRILRPHAMLLRGCEKGGEKYECVMNTLHGAGQQLVLKGFINREIEKQIQMELISKDSFIKRANRVWHEAIKKRKFL